MPNFKEPTPVYKKSSGFKLRSGNSPLTGDKAKFTTKMHTGTTIFGKTIPEAKRAIKQSVKKYFTFGPRLAKRVVKEAKRAAAKTK